MKIPAHTRVRRDWRATIEPTGKVKPAAQRRDLARFMPRNSNELDRLANNDLARATVSAHLERAIGKCSRAFTSTTANQWEIVECALHHITQDDVDAAREAAEEATALFTQESRDFQQAPLDEMALRSNEIEEYLPFAPSVHQLCKENGKFPFENHVDAELLEIERERYDREEPPPQFATGRRRQYFKQPRLDWTPSHKGPLKD